MLSIHKTINFFTLKILFLSIAILGNFPKIAQAETYQILGQFDGKNGSFPASSVITDSKGNLYGTTTYGPKRFGTVFKLTPQGVIQTLFHFSRDTGTEPISGLIWGKDGNLYGTTRYRGKRPDGKIGSGTVYKMTPNGQFSLLHVFDNRHGQLPGPGLLLANDGNFYGVTSLDHGTIYRVNYKGDFTVLYKFSGHGKLNGSHPSSPLIQAKDGFLYGTTAGGGKYNHNQGTIFKISLDGNFSTIWDFNDKKLKGGRMPTGSLVEGSDGNLYGTTREGGNYGYGTIFKITPNGNLTTLVHFNGQNGRYPETALIEGNKGIFYGVTLFGGNSSKCSSGCGTLFKVTSDGNLTTLVNFNGKNGSFPKGYLTKDSKGNIYGTTVNGGSNSTCPESEGKGCGLVFKLSP